MAKRKTKAMLEAELVLVLDSLAGAREKYQDLANELLTVRRLNAGLNEMVGKMQDTIETKDGLVRESNAILRARDGRINDLEATLQVAQDEIRRWKGQYQNADKRIHATEAVAFLFAIPAATISTMPDIIKTVTDNAQIVGVEMTDEVKAAAKLALSKAASAVLAEEMDHATERDETTPEETDSLSARLSRIMGFDPADNK